jgi:hypothetical protein
MGIFAALECRPLEKKENTDEKPPSQGGIHSAFECGSKNKFKRLN